MDHSEVTQVVITPDERPAAVIMMISSSIAVVALFWPTIATLVHTWSESRTYAHGFLVLPGAIYLLWCYRDRIIQPRPEPWGWVVVAVPGGVSVAGYLLQNLLVQQASVISMFPSLVYALWGRTVFRNLVFPLGFLIFALPIGTALEPWLQEVTTILLSIGLQTAGIPFYQEGYFVTMPSGTWKVAPDCGGLRYLLPGLALGYLYAAVMYRQILPRVYFLILCTALLIVANALRAYGIIVGDYLGIADGMDHRVFSYTIYGVTVVFLAWVGRRWSSAAHGSAVADTNEAGAPFIRRATANTVGAITLLALASFVTSLLPAPSTQAARTETEQATVSDGQERAETVSIHVPTP